VFIVDVIVCKLTYVQNLFLNLLDKVRLDIDSREYCEFEMAMHQNSSL
jgi:hypothetical protein